MMRNMWFLLFICIAPFTPFIDIYLTHLCYSSETGFYNNALFFGLFKYGEWFGLATAGLALGIFFLSLCSPRWKKWRKGALAMVLTLVIGAGLITNVVLKGYWGRPRPKQVIEFGGQHSYRPFWQPNFHTSQDPQKSFPSGHVAMGFYFLSLYLVGKRYRNGILQKTGLFLVLFLGGGLMVARITQGGHFFSDVIASAILMWYVAKVVDWCLFTWGGWEMQSLNSNTSNISPVPDDA